MSEDVTYISNLSHLLRPFSPIYKGTVLDATRIISILLWFRSRFLDLALDGYDAISYSK